MTTDTEKQQLRKTMRRLASQLSPRYRAAADEAIARHLLSLPEYRSAGAVFCFVSAGREIDTRPILERTLADGRTLCVPLCVTDGVMELRAVRDLKELSPGAYGILEPPADSPALSPGPDRPGGDPLCHLQPGGPPAGPGRRVLRPLPGPLPGRGGAAVPGAAAAAGDPLRPPRLPHSLGHYRGRSVRGRHPRPAGVRAERSASHKIIKSRRGSPQHFVGVLPFVFLTWSAKSGKLEKASRTETITHKGGPSP